VIDIKKQEIFRRSCLEAVQGASPFDPLPFHFDRLEEEKYLTVALTFYLRRQDQAECRQEKAPAISRISIQRYTTVKAYQDI